MASLMTVAALCQGNEMETVLLKGCLYESDLKDSLQFMHIYEIMTSGSVTGVTPS